MTDIKFSLPGTDIIMLSGSTADKLIRVGDGDAALLYLYILKTKGQNSSGQAAEALGKTRGDIADAMATLSRLGLINCIIPQAGTPAPEENEHDPARQPMPDQPRQYTASEIAREKTKNPDFSVLVEETQRSLGKLLSGDELERLMGIYDGLRLPTEVILLLITHCIRESRSRSGGRMPSMRYIETVAYQWERDEIITPERAEEYLKKLDEKKTARGKMKQALKISDRELSKSEKTYVDEWISLGFESEAVEIAYDITVLRTGKRAWQYINKIINNWHEAGIRTTAQVIEREKRCAADKSYFKSALNDGDKFGSANPQSLERLQRLLQKIKEE